MIVLVGTNETKIKSGKINNVTCSDCKIVSTFEYSIFSEYTYLTLIPLFPIKKRAEIYCCNCKNIIDFNDLSDEDLQKFSNENHKLKNPIWLFSGCIILVICLSYFGYNYFKISDKTKALIKNPINKDILFIKNSNGYYSTLRIDKVTNDSIFTTVNDYDAYMPYEIDDINKSENYSTNKINYSRNDILKMYQDEEIISIKRN